MLQGLLHCWLGNLYSLLITLILQDKLACKDNFNFSIIMQSYQLEIITDQLPVI